MAEGIDGPDEFVTRNSQIKFVTFNFDSLIEETIAAFVRGLFRMTPKEEQAVLEAFPVIHVHGRLPDPPNVNVATAAGTVLPAWKDWLIRAAPHVNVVHDTLDGSRLDPARNAVSNARVLFFLGFGFDTSNLERLNLPQAFSRDTNHHYFASGYKMDHVDKQAALDLFGRHNYSNDLVLTIGEPDLDCQACVRRLAWVKR